MREIKFRFWSNYLKNFVVPDDTIFIGALKDPDMNPMQFTGLIDRDGKEIYEGDILRNRHGVRGVVVWKAKTARFVKRTNLNDNPIGSGCRVIGNVYAHPELLETKS